MARPGHCGVQKGVSYEQPEELRIRTLVGVAVAVAVAAGQAQEEPLEGQMVPRLQAAQAPVERGLRTRDLACVSGFC